MAVFEKDGKSFAFPIGSTKAGEFQIYSDEMCSFRIRTIYISIGRPMYGARLIVIR